MVNTEIRLIIFFAAKDGEALYSQQKQDRELTGSDHELLITKFRLKLKKVGKTTRRRDGGAWWAAVYGFAQSWTRLKQVSSSSSSSRENH